MPAPAPKRNVERIVHEVFREHASDEYRRRDKTLRFVGLGGVVVALVSLGVGNAINQPWVMACGAGVGLGVFAVALFKASRLYKHSRLDFIKASMADDGTFLFCPKCRYDLRGSQTTPTSCPECGAVPWKFEQTEA